MSSKTLEKKCKQANAEWLNEKYVEIKTLWNIDNRNPSNDKRTNRTKDLLMNRMYKIQERDTGIRERKNTSVIE